MLPLRAEPVEATLYREAMSRIGAAVHIVTTQGPAGRAGLTATAFASVSDSPPTVLVCLNAAGVAAMRIRANGVFAVNTLTPAQEALADHFAGRTGVHGEERFNTGPTGGSGTCEAGTWESGLLKVPLLAGALVQCVARVVDMKPVATHLVVFGEVVSVALGENAPGLVYTRRGYRAV